MSEETINVEGQNDVMRAVSILFPDAPDLFDPKRPTPDSFEKVVDHLLPAITSAPGFVAPTIAQMQDALVQYQQGQATQQAIATDRAGLRTYWEALPDFITGPFGAAFSSAQQFLDEGKPGRAYELIRLTPALDDYGPDERAQFEVVKTTLLQDLATLKAAMEGA